MNTDAAKDSATPSFIIRPALYGLGLNAVWEYAQCSVFYDMPDLSFSRHALLMWAAIFGDVVIVLGITYLSRLTVGAGHLSPLDQKGWLALLGFGWIAGVILEWAARHLNLWSYNQRMPVIIILGESVGLSPILQITVVPALSVYLSTRRSQPGKRAR